MVISPRNRRLSLIVALSLLVVAVFGYAAYVHFLPTPLVDQVESVVEVPSGPEKGYADFTADTYKREGDKIYARISTLDQWKLLPADAASFVVLKDGDEMSHSYAKDKDSVYYDEGVIAYADPVSFRILDYNWINSLAADSSAFYFATFRAAVPDADSYDLSLPSGSGNGYFLRKGSGLYRISFISSNGQLTGWDGPTLVPGGDPSTLAAVIDSNDAGRPFINSVGRVVFIKDKNQVYCLGNVVAGADPSTFRIAYDAETQKEFPGVVARDKDFGYTEFCKIVGKKTL